MNFTRIQRFIGTKRWIRTGIRNRLCRKYPKGRSFRVPFCGYSYQGNFSNFVDRNVYFFGGYEMEELLFMRTYLKGATVLDIGANVGQHAVFFSRYAKEVHAFEPNQIVQELEENAKANRIDTVRVHQIALGADDGRAPFYTSAMTEVGSFVPEHYAHVNKNMGDMRVYNGDRYLAEHAITSVDFIKLDVEGYEEEVLRGLRHTLERCRPILWMEWIEAIRKEFGTPERTLPIPPGYRAYGFEYNRPHLLFFNDARVRLVPLDPAYRRRNILLLPEEKIPSASAPQH